MDINQSSVYKSKVSVYKSKEMYCALPPAPLIPVHPENPEILSNSSFLNPERI
jgi:hypothetical protein